MKSSTALARKGDKGIAMGRRMPKFRVAAIFLAVPGYVLCTLAAYAWFPGSFSPARNWLSDLGDANQNPTGAIFYNLGIVLTGLLVLFFFLSLSLWKIKTLNVQNRLVTLTQIFGVTGSIAMLLSAVFPINHPQEHQILSIALYILLGTAFAFSVSALRYQPVCPKWMLAVGLVTAFVDILSGIYHEATLLEWITVALFLVYLLLLNQLTRRLERQGSSIPAVTAPV